MRWVPDRKLKQDSHRNIIIHRSWSISWLLMVWFVGYQEQWYWLCKVCRCLSSVGNSFNYTYHFNSSPTGQIVRHFADNIFRCIFMNEKFCILIRISLKFLPKRPIDNKSALVLVMAWRRTCDKPLAEPNADIVHWCIYPALGGWVNDEEWYKMQIHTHSSRK